MDLESFFVYSMSGGIVLNSFLIYQILRYFDSQQSSLKGTNYNNTEKFRIETLKLMTVIILLLGNIFMAIVAGVLIIT